LVGVDIDNPIERFRVSLRRHADDILSLEADDHAISAERELQPAAMRLQLHGDALVVLEP
jgi:hypothetical protein